MLDTTSSRGMEEVSETTLEFLSSMLNATNSRGVEEVNKATPEFREDKAICTSSIWLHLL